MQLWLACMRAYGVDRDDCGKTVFCTAAVGRVHCGKCCLAVSGFLLLSEGTRQLSRDLRSPLLPLAAVKRFGVLQFLCRHYWTCDKACQTSSMYSSPSPASLMH